MSEHHSNLRVRFYPQQGQWVCVVQPVDADGMPLDEDLVSGLGASKEEARDRAWASASDPNVRSALKPRQP